MKKSWKVYLTKSPQYHDRASTGKVYIVVGTFYKEKTSQNMFTFQAKYMSIQTRSYKIHESEKFKKPEKKSNPPWLRALMQ